MCPASLPLLSTSSPLDRQGVDHCASVTSVSLYEEVPCDSVSQAALLPSPGNRIYSRCGLADPTKSYHVSASDAALCTQSSAPLTSLQWEWASNMLPYLCWPKQRGEWPRHAWPWVRIHCCLAAKVSFIRIRWEEKLLEREKPAQNGRRSMLLLSEELRQALDWRPNSKTNKKKTIRLPIGLVVTDHFSARWLYVVHSLLDIWSWQCGSAQ